MLYVQYKTLINLVRKDLSLQPLTAGQAKQTAPAPPQAYLPYSSPYLAQPTGTHHEPPRSQHLQVQAREAAMIDPRLAAISLPGSSHSNSGTNGPPATITSRRMQMESSPVPVVPVFILEKSTVSAICFKASGFLVIPYLLLSRCV